SGAQTVASPAPARRRARIAAILTVVGVIGGAVMIAAGAIRLLSSQAAFFGGGALLLLGTLSAIGWALRSHQRAQVRERWSIGSLAVAAARRHPARSLLTVSLIALASFLL